MAVSLIVIFSLSSSYSLVGKAVQRIDFAKANSEVMMEVKGVEGVQYVTFYFNQPSKEVVVYVNNVTNIQFDGKSYSQFTISSEKANLIDKTKISLRLSDSQIKQLGITSVSLYQNGRKLPAAYLKSDTRGYSYYEATVTEFGEFVIGEETVKPSVAEKAKPAAAPETVVPVSLPVEKAKPAAQQEPAANMPTTSAPAPLAGKAVEPEPKKEESMFSKISSFFKEVFG